MQRTLSAAIRAGCDPYSPCALASAQLVCGVERHTELSEWMGSQCSPNAAQTVFRGLRVSVYLSQRSKCWHTDNHF